MTLHQTIDVAKKFLLGIAAGIGVIIIIALFFQLGIIIKNTLFPPAIQPPTHLYDVLPKIQFPQNVTENTFTYTLNTVTGTLPDFPDRLNVFLIEKPQPNFLNLNKAKEKATKLGFLTDQGTVVPEIDLGNNTYRWILNGDQQKTLTMSILSFDFSLTSNYLTSSDVLAAKKLGDQASAINVATQFLDAIGLTPNDLDSNKTTTQLFTSTLIPTTNLSKAQVIRVDFFQKNMTYALNTGNPEVSGGMKKLDLDLPILYPHPPYSTMNFLVGSGSLSPEIVSANFIHKDITADQDSKATYPIKSAQEAFDELKNGKGYIASYAGDDQKIEITKIYLAYYMGEDPQEYLMPIIVFEGNNDFFAYISAVKDEWTK